MPFKKPCIDYCNNDLFAHKLNFFQIYVQYVVFFDTLAKVLK